MPGAAGVAKWEDWLPESETLAPDQFRTSRGEPPAPLDKLLVADIFGWPRSDTDVASATYRIDLVPNPNSADTAHPRVFDCWPVCYDPDHQAPSDGSFNQGAWGWNTAGGLRLVAFLDQFGRSGLRFSICERDFSGAMTAIGKALGRRMTSSCLPGAVSQFTDCTWHLPIPDGMGGYLAQPDAVPRCDAAAAAALCYTLTPDSAACDAGEYRVQAIPPSSIMPGTVLQLDCR
jgi:hypothetical protein